MDLLKYMSNKNDLLKLFILLRIKRIKMENLLFIVEMGNKSGVSRQNIKERMFLHFGVSEEEVDSLLRIAIQDNLLLQPKGPSGPIKVNKEKERISFPYTTFQDFDHKTFFKMTESN